MAEVFEEHSMSNRIISTLDGILKNDIELYDFTIVTTEANIKNKSPVLYESHSLGLESWCIKSVYQHASNVLFNRRKRLKYRKLSYDKMDSLNSFLNSALLINPDVGTFWNMKRELIEYDILSIDNELRFSRIVLTHKSKSNETFAYRRWLIRKILDKLSRNKLQIPENILQTEFAITHLAAEKSKNNYHSWNHRIWCIEQFASVCANISNVLDLELKYSQEWITKHVSECSGYHYRQYLIMFLRDCSEIDSIIEFYYNFTLNKLELVKENEYRNLLSYLLDKPNKKRILEESSSYINYICVLLYDLIVLFQEINHLFFGHESLYYHRRFLIFHLLRVPFEYFAIEYPAPKVTVTNINLWNENITKSNNTTYISGNNYLKKFNDNFGNCALIEIIASNENRFISNQNNYLTEEYQKWLKNIIGFE